jgi:hypothetical protein
MIGKRKKHTEFLEMKISLHNPHPCCVCPPYYVGSDGLLYAVVIEIGENDLEEDFGVEASEGHGCRFESERGVGWSLVK